MAENEILTSDSGEEMLDANADYVSALNELKANSVSKQQYEKLRAENKKLLDALIHDEKIDMPETQPVDVNALRKELFNRDNQLTNLDYVDKALKLRTALIESGEQDPFLPVGTHVQITQDMVDSAENVATVLQECVDFAQGNSGIFTAELQRRTVDTQIPGVRRR